MPKLKVWLPFIIYAAFIFAVSSLPGGRVDFTRIVWDKALHLIEYTPLGMCAAYGLYNSRLFKSLFGLWILAASLCFAYGLSDEFHQSLVPGREASIWDAMADFLGGMIGAGIYCIFRKPYKYS